MAKQKQRNRGYRITSSFFVCYEGGKMEVKETYWKKVPFSNLLKRDKDKIWIITIEIYASKKEIDELKKFEAGKIMEYVNIEV